MQREEYHLIIKNHLRSAYLLTDARIKEVMPRFMATLETLMQDLEKHSGAENVKELNRSGHALKGALLNLGLEQLAEKAYSIEKLDPLLADTKSAANLVADLKKEINKIT